MLLIDLIKWKIVDIKRAYDDRRNGIIKFKPFGLRMYCGRQGAGKTVAMVEQLEEWRVKYPKAIICTNFYYKHQDYALQSLNDLLTIRNGTDGVIFAIDEIQNEFSSTTSRNFPELLLSTITMQRKQRIVILTTSQVYTRVAKQLREQCFEVVECRTFLGRYTRERCYDAIDYNMVVDSKNPDAKLKCDKKWRYSFIQSDDLRDSYDTWQVVERLARDGFGEKPITIEVTK